MTRPHTRALGAFAESFQPIGPFERLLSAPGSSPAGQAPSGLDASRFDPCRTLATVLADMREAEERIKFWTQRWVEHNCTGDEKRADTASDSLATLDSLLFDFRNEARQMIADTMGVPWADIEKAGL